MHPHELRCEHLVDPIGVDSPDPRLSWLLAPGADTTLRGQRQTAYHVLIASSAEVLASGAGDLWDSGRVDSAQSIQLAYAGNPLRSLQACYWKVRVWDQNGEPSGWSRPAYWRMGIVKTEDWRAKWILCPAAGPDGGAASGLCPWFRQTFALTELPSDATACVASIGFHELHINGQKVGGQVLAPSVSDLRKRALYHTYEIAPFLKEGLNAVAIWLAPGWSTFSDKNPIVDFGLEKKPLCLAQLDFDEFHPPIVTDETWRCAPSNTWHVGRWQNGNFGGDRVDGTMETTGWNMPDFDVSAWLSAVAVDLAGRKLSADLIEPNRLSEPIPAIQVTPVTSGKYTFTLEQLFAGWIALRVKGAPGTTIVITVSSLADREVQYFQRNEYVIGATGEGTFQNRFSYHLCQYVTVESLADAPELTDLVGYRVTNDRALIGAFDCSDPLLKQIYDITVHTYLNLCTGGMVVDCPHRERLGYGGDGHVSLDIGLDTFASGAFFTKWARDWCDIQDPSGRINHTAPTIGGGGGPAWSGFIITLPWETYLHCGDRRILERTYPAARKWLEHLAGEVGADGLLQPSNPGDWSYMDGGVWLFLGDWVAPSSNEASDTPAASLFNNCYYLYVLRLAIRIGHILKQDGGGLAILTARGDQLSEAINRRFFNPDDSSYLDTKQTHCVMPLLCGAVASDHVSAVENNLEHEILVKCRGHLDTGMHGTYFLTKYLGEHFRSDLIYSYASKRTYPGWGDLIEKGYTSWPETWGGADSRLHGCLNGIGGWFQRGLGGIFPDEENPGYKHFFIRPSLVGNLSWVRCSHDSPNGRIVSNWTCQNGEITLEVSVPPNSTAKIYLPTNNEAEVTESGQVIELVQGLCRQPRTAGACVITAESGNYFFRAPLR